MMRLIRPLTMIATLLGDGGRDADVLLDDEDRDVALVAEPDQHLLDLGDDHRREALGRLVHDQKMRIGHAARARSPASAARRPRAGRRRCSCVRPAAGRCRRCARPSRRRSPRGASCADARRPSASARAGVLAARSRCRGARSRRASGRRGPAPRMRIEPLDARTRPMIVLQSVVLPMPLRPTTESTPCSSVRSTPCSACERP